MTLVRTPSSWTLTLSELRLNISILFVDSCVKITIPFSAMIGLRIQSSALHVFQFVDDKKSMHAWISIDASLQGGIPMFLGGNIGDSISLVATV